MSAPKVDVLAVMDRHIERNFERGAAKGSPSDRELRQARDAVAELIEAAAEYRRGTECHVRDCVYCHDRSTRMDVAIARISGAA